MDRDKCGPIGLAILDSGLNVPQVASALEVNIKTMYSYAYGRTEPSGAFLLKLADHLKCEPKKLVTAM